MYLAQHSGGVWLSRGDIPRDGDGRIVAYASRHGHASCSGTGSNLSNSTTGESGRSGLVPVWTHKQHGQERKDPRVPCCHQILRADFLGTQINAPDWSRFCRRWGRTSPTNRKTSKELIKSSLGGIPYADKAANTIWDAVRMKPRRKRPHRPVDERLLVGQRITALCAHGVPPPASSRGLVPHTRAAYTAPMNQTGTGVLGEPARGDAGAGRLCLSQRPLSGGGYGARCAGGAKVGAASARLASPAMASIFTAYFPSNTFGSVYCEGRTFLHVEHGRTRAVFSPWMLVDDDVALILGRELLGYPRSSATSAGPNPTATGSAAWPSGGVQSSCAWRSPGRGRGRCAAYARASASQRAQLARLGAAQTLALPRANSSSKSDGLELTVKVGGSGAIRWRSWALAPSSPPLYRVNLAAPVCRCPCPGYRRCGSCVGFCCTNPKTHARSGRQRRSRDEQRVAFGKARPF